MSDYLCQTSVQIQDVQRLLSDDSEREIQSWSCEEIGEGRGMMSHMVRVQFIWADGEGPSSVIAKIPSMDGLNRMADSSENDKMMRKVQKQVVERLEKIHNCEVSVYNLLGKLEQPPVVMPKLYHAEQMGMERPAMILMEDLSQNAGSPDLISSTTPQQLHQLAAELARLHCWSMQNSHWQSNPGFYGGLADFYKENEAAHQDKFDAFLKEIQEPRWVQALGPKIIEQIGKLSCQIGETEQVMEQYKQLELPEVLVHGDFHTMNFLFELDQAGRPTGDLKAIVDWQLAHPGSPVEDFVRIFSTYMPTQLRRQYQEEVFQHYFLCLEKELGHPLPFSKEKFIKNFNLMLIFMIKRGVPMLPAGAKMFRSGVLKTAVSPEEAEKVYIDRKVKIIEDILFLIESAPKVNK